MKYALMILLALLGARCEASETPYQGFWSWFQQHEDAYFLLDPSDVTHREPLFDELSSQLEKVNPDLTFEFGPPVGGKRDFVISAAGIKDAFPAVQELVAHAPSLVRWRVIAFRPRRTPVSIVRFQDVSLDPRRVLVQIAQDGNKIGLTLLIENYTKEKDTEFGQAAYLLLDEALGEFDVETKVGFIQFKPLPKAVPTDTIPLSELAGAFDRFYGSLPGES
jgi:hypothetical protein